MHNTTIFKRVLLIIGIVVITFVGLAAAYLYRAIPHSSEKALVMFFNSNFAEDQLADPLILAGKKVVPRLLEEITKKDMPRRRYAIYALGQIGEPSAIPILESIMNDSSEADYIRCDALEAIALIDRGRGRLLANQYGKGIGGTCLIIVESILSNSSLEHRSFFDALIHKHD